MNVTYYDRHGKAWRFAAPTDYQTLLLERALRAARAVGSRERLTLGFLVDDKANDEFLKDVEALILSALAERYPAKDPPPTPTPTPQPQHLTQPPTPTPDTSTPQAEAADEFKKTYYWENF